MQALGRPCQGLTTSQRHSQPLSQTVLVSTVAKQAQRRACGGQAPEHHLSVPHKLTALSSNMPRQQVVAAAASMPAPSAQPSVVKDDFAVDTRPVILYDGVCNLCNGAVNFMLDWDTRGAFRMAALQSQAGQRLLERSGRRRDDISSIVLVEKGGHFIKSEAVLRIARGISNPWPLLAMFGLPVPLFVRDVAYDLVANNRYNILGKRDECRLSNKGFEDRFIVD